MRRLPYVEPDKVAVIQGAVWNELVSLVETLRPLTSLTSETLVFFQGDKGTKIEVKSRAGVSLSDFGERALAVCDESGATVIIKVLAK